ncbi:MAG TPA: hypothetical protein VIO15_06695, partial [Bacteroidales bacterium]
FVFASCSKDDDDNNTSSTEYKAPSVAHQNYAVEIPEALAAKVQNDNYLMGLTGALQSVNYLAQACFAQFPIDTKELGNASSKSNSDGSVTYSVSIQQGIFYLTYFYSSAKSSWTAEFQYTGTNSKTKIAYVEETGNAGKAEYYYDSGKVALKYFWTDEKTGQKIVVTGYDEQGKVDLTWNIVSNDDKSGSMKAYDAANVLIYDITWKADGTGSYTINSEDGTIKGTF